MMQAPLTRDDVIAATRIWLERAVIGLNLCPFAKSVHVKNQVRYVVSEARDVDSLYRELKLELDLLQNSGPEQIDTILLIHPWVLNDFLDYNEFLGIADTTLEELDLIGEIQIASLHPQYQFAGTLPDDISNFTNRSPYPTLHLLRESSIDRAVAAFPDASEIYERNIETMERLGHEGWKALLSEGTCPVSNMEKKESDRT